MAMRTRRPPSETPRDLAATPGLSATADRLDRLMTLEIRPLAGGLPPGIVVPTYVAARQVQDGALSALAARRLGEALAEGGTVLVATGAGVAPKLPGGETDGPPGAAVLGLALADGFGARCVLLAQGEHLPAVRASAAVFADRLGAQPMEVAEFPKGEAEGREAARELVERHRPVAIVFVERDGPNEAGHYHGVRGDRRPAGTVAHVHLLAEEARTRGVPTIGIGDGGNEIGFGLIRDAVSALLPNGGRSQPDETGVVTVTATDVLLSASVSNWGCYAVAGALSVIAGRNLLHAAHDEHALIEACVGAGARDGATGEARLAVDGIDADGHGAFVTLMRSVVDAALRFPAAERQDSEAADRGLIEEIYRATAQGGV
ncbi:glutamate cyclase domain-containing protein [Antarcticirhabdus aurantiaca]|uniref:DUF4392 domain-containing protein n=1 Tax=Antarcticirhabdus aurantiaca TaxID=2606717 RepID=A0ACD4NR63_9HYPH|nr:glutamate cyclase domain-containing protein [Antarcticirhabdus aurantiaca]WAJ29406.1 DUF4392 domain-containing protein [Jeongeuplla avenae]